MKNVIITGAAQGIGYYLMRQLLCDGFNVTAFDLDVENLRSLEDEYHTLMAIKCDVRDGAQLDLGVKASAERFGGVDCAVHNACICTFDAMEDTDDDTYRNVFDVNYFGALNLTRAVMPYMKTRKSGKIIYTSSGVGVMGFVNISPYASSKGAVESLAKCMNIEYQKFGVTFHLFHPPLTKTRSSAPLPVPKEFMADPEKVGIGLAKNIHKKSFIICHSAGQKAQTIGCYLMPVKMGRLMSKMTSNYVEKKIKQD